MGRVFVAVIATIAALLSVTSPASAGESARIVIGHADGSFEVETVPAATVASAIARAERDPEVTYAEPDVVLRAVDVVPNDPMYAEQWGPQQVRMPEAWARTTGDPSIIVAVVDTGVDPTNPDLAGSVLPGKSMLEGDSSDPNGHGTAVAGVVAAHGNNGAGVAGYCWSCKILPVRALDAQGAGSGADVALGIRWAADNGADIINLSMAGPGSSTALDDAIAYAQKKDIIVLAAAGNQAELGDDLTVPQYPAATAGVIGVIATNRDDGPYYWTYRGSWADLAAPGCVLTTRPGSGFGSECGTSFSSPAVAGILALAFSAFPKVSRGDVVDHLYATTVPIAGRLAANGRVDAAAFLDRVSGTSSSSIQPDRIAGADRIATSVELSKRSYPDGTATVVIARADSYADALAAAPLAARLDAPVLLTVNDTLSSAVGAEVRRLGATTAWLAGGTAALSPAVESVLAANGITENHRIAGSSRYDTARQVAEQLGGTSVFVTSATAWPDAVAASGLAASTQTPILLVERDSVPADTSAALGALRPSSITVIGGSGVVADHVLRSLQSGSTSVARIAGATRYATSLAVAQAALDQGLTTAHTWVATGADWPDALAAGPASAKAGAILILVDGRTTAISSSLTSWLDNTDDLVVVGGPASITLTVAAALAELL